MCTGTSSTQLGNNTSLVNVSQASHFNSLQGKQDVLTPRLNNRQASPFLPTYLSNFTVKFWGIFAGPNILSCQQCAAGHCQSQHTALHTHICAAVREREETGDSSDSASP